MTLKIRRQLRRAALWACAFLAAFSAAASPFLVDSWNNEEGLPDSEVISVVQSRNGYLWLGTLHGLVRFDGIHFTVFNVNNTPGLGSDRIVYLFEDNETDLWAGTESGGLVRIKNGAVKNFQTENFDIGKIIYAYEDASNNVWFCAQAGRFFRYHDGKIDFHPSVFSTELFFRAARIIVPSQSNGFWRLQNGRVQKWKNNRLQKDFGKFPWGNAVVTAACEDGKGDLIVGTLGAGIFWYDAAGKYEAISKDEGLSSAYVLSLCVDNEGNLWAGTDGGGLDRIKRKLFNAPAELHPWTAQSLSADARGGVWAAFNAGGVSYWTTNGVENFGVGRGSNAWTVLADREQNVWVGTRDEGLFEFQTNQFVPAPGAEICGAQINALFESHAGQLWVGTQNGLADFDGQKWKLFTTRDGLSGNAIRAIAQDAGGDFWIGTESDGLDFFKNGKFTVFRKSETGLPGDDISCLLADDDGALWVGTAGHGLARLQNGKWTRYSSFNGLPSDSISYLAEDGENIWIGSNMGLTRISKRTLENFSGGTIFCRTYGKNDGLPTRECSGGSQPAAVRAADGELFFPTTKGVVCVNPAELKPDLQPPKVLIESVRVDGREQETNRLDSTWPSAIVLPPGSEQLEIDYTALNFSAPDAVRFKYRLEGHETAWTDAGNGRVARYPKLAPGNYRFHVIACNEDGIWNETGATLEITMQPYFWQTTGFRAAVIVLILAMVAAVVRYFSTQKLQRQLQSLKQKEALERERARIARDLHDQLGANLTQVALLGEMAEADKNSPEEIESHAQQISQTARETTRALDEIVWAINPSNDTLEGLANYACKYAQEYLALAGLRQRVDVPAQLPAIPIPPPVRHNVFLAFKEAVHNVVKHAQATEVWIRLRLSPGEFILEVEDDGRGIAEADRLKSRNGLRNMKKRLEEIGGEFSISPRENGGTIARLKIPLAK